MQRRDFLKTALATNLLPSIPTSVFTSAVSDTVMDVGADTYNPMKLGSIEEMMALSRVHFLEWAPEIEKTCWGELARSIMLDFKKTKIVYRSKYEGHPDRYILPDENKHLSEILLRIESGDIDVISLFKDYFITFKGSVKKENINLQVKEAMFSKVSSLVNELGSKEFWKRFSDERFYSCPGEPDPEITLDFIQKTVKDSLSYNRSNYEYSMHQRVDYD